MRTPLILVAVALIAVGAGAFFFMAGGGNEPANATYSFDDWQMHCQAEKTGRVCGLTQQLVDRQAGRAVLQVSFGAAPNGAHVLGVVVPLGVSVPDGVTLQVADATRKFEYSQCLPGGCIASLAVDDALIDKMKATPDAKLAVIDRTGKPVVMPISLKGFGPAIEKMNASGGGGWLSFFGGR